MRQELWPADTFVDFDHGLNSAVARLRESLRDSAEKPRFIETVAKRGYRFIAPIQRRKRKTRQLREVLQHKIAATMGKVMDPATSQVWQWFARHRSGHSIALFRIHNWQRLR